MWTIIFDNLSSFFYIFHFMLCFTHGEYSVRWASRWLLMVWHFLVWACELVDETRVEIWNLNGGSNWAVRNGMYSIVPRGREILALLHLPPSIIAHAHTALPSRFFSFGKLCLCSCSCSCFDQKQKMNPHWGGQKKRVCIFPHYYLNQK